VGKSWLIILTIQWLRYIGIEVVVVDADDETSTLSRFIPEARFIAIRNPTAIDEIIQIAIEAPADVVVVVDLPARAGNEFGEWFELIPWGDLAQQGIEFTALAVVAGTKDSIEGAIRWRDFLKGGNPSFLIAINERDDVGTYLGSKTRQGFQAAMIPEISIPKMDSRLSAALDARSWTIAQALQTEKADYLTQLMSRARLRRYRDQIYSQFETVKAHLLP
jgi:hypothetical protein